MQPSRIRYPHAGARGGALQSRSAEMLVARMRELHHSTAAHDARTAPRQQLTDARIAPALGWQLREQLGHPHRRDCEAQFIVIAAAQGEEPRALVPERG